jgi:GTPase SAR1 family protein
VIGPTGTGKTVLLAALFYEATRSRQFRLRVQQGEEYLHSIVSPLFRAEYPPRTSTSVFETVGFYISRGRRPFDQTVTISTIDYAGEWIERYADDVLTFATIESDNEKRLESMLAVADALIIVLPSDLASSEVSELSYKKILDAIVRARDLSPRRKLDIAIAVVVTKSDLNEKELAAGPERFAMRLSIFYDTIRSLTRPDKRFFFATSILPSLERLITFGVADLLDWLLYET